MKSNRLKNEKSPYLIGHADNPVDWYPWSEEAFIKAQEENKPVFLSIGYSTCHWCHVMEKESFRDTDVSKILNKYFVAIKVDREERPDIDAIYMRACQMMTGSGGWPLTIIMTPTRKPFFAGTYFPKTASMGRPGLLELLLRVSELWETKKDEINGSAAAISDALQRAESSEDYVILGDKISDEAFKALSQSFDAENGGFGTAPKFPMPHVLCFLLRYAKRKNSSEAMRMVEVTLEKMRLGGIFDQLGYGFHRYATDPTWLVPHFEKMLYDQALLSMSYVEAYQATGKAKYAEATRATLEYISGNLLSKEGGFYSAEDADSDGGEGKFYLWRSDEIERLFGRKDRDAVFGLFGIKDRGNFSDPLSNESGGENILHLSKLSGTGHNDLPRFRRMLLEARGKRPRPFMDDKILTDWNGLAIAAFAKAASVLGEEVYLERAEAAADFVIKKLSNSGGLLHRFWRGHSSIDGFLDDYAFMIWGLLELYEASLDDSRLECAMKFAKVMTADFWDDAKGGFFFSSTKSEKLPGVVKEVYDGAIPSGNSVALLDLIRLGRMTADPEIEEYVLRLVEAFSSRVASMPHMHAQFLTAFEYLVGPSYEIVISGKPGRKDTEKMLAALRRTFLPNKVLMFVRNGKQGISEAAQGYLGQYPLMNGKATAYVCRNRRCAKPTNSIKEMLSFLK